jgi:3-hydroxyacyl-CoA dehydrogenase/enoyl-CoA hydratase/3-hydroxybutyryl-CoA epimerase/enoyl-CoA isomerase
MFAGRCLRVEYGADGIAELCFDRRNEAINKFDVSTVDELKCATQIIRAADGVRGVLVTSAKEAFIVGADIFEFTTLFAQPQAQIKEYIARQNAVFTAFDDLHVPSVVAINGLALGGGLEMALAADVRVMAASAHVGLPEVSLGIFPGFGGTVRLPRLTGAATAIDWITSGKPQNAQSALAAGAVDAVVTSEALRNASLEQLQALMRSKDWRGRRQQRHGAFGADSAAFQSAKLAAGRVAMHQPAALAAIELLERAAGLSRDAALELEHAAFAKIALTQAAASLVQLFINDQAIRKKARSLAKTARKVRRAGILGAGIMGGGIAYSSAVRGIPVYMKDITQGALDLGVAEASKLLSKQVRSGRLQAAQAEAVLAMIHPALDYDGAESLAKSWDIVIEAVIENIDVKKKVLAEVEQRVKPDTVIASNTSSLSITEMAGVLLRPENFVGLHFFNPVPVMPLVEVIRGPGTSDAAVAAVVGYAIELGKTPVVVKECPGFLVNRVLTPYMIGFLRALHEGADFLAIDRVMEGFGWPMGPAYLQDVVGLDTLLHVLRVISAGLAPRLQLDFPHAVELLVQQGRLGQKSGGGFYRYERDPAGKPKRLADPLITALLATIQPHGPKAIPDHELLERLMLPMIIEAARCLEEGIVQSPADVDTSLVLGLGFPRYAGGPLKYADWLGMNEVVTRCDAYATLGPMYAPTEGMRSLAAAGVGYYDQSSQGASRKAAP